MLKKKLSSMFVFSPEEYNLPVAEKHLDESRPPASFRSFMTTVNRTKRQEQLRQRKQQSRAKLALQAPQEKESHQPETEAPAELNLETKVKNLKDVGLISRLV